MGAVLREGGVRKSCFSPSVTGCSDRGETFIVCVSTVRECELSCDGGIGLVPKRTTLYGLVNLSARRSLGVDGLDFHLEGQMIWMPSMS